MMETIVQETRPHVPVCWALFILPYVLACVVFFALPAFAFAHEAPLGTPYFCNNLNIALMRG